MWGELVEFGQTDGESQQSQAPCRRQTRPLFGANFVRQAGTFLVLETGDRLSTSKLSLFLVNTYEQSNPTLENHSHGFSGEDSFPVD